jgi:hypothetical protein
MKKTMLAFLAVALAAIPAQAQMFRPSVVQGAVIGGAAGAVIGHNSGRHAGEGAAIGVVAGALLGAALDRPSQRHAVPVPAPVVYAPAPAYCPPPPVQVVYVQPRRIVYQAAPCPPPQVVYYPYQPAPVVVYQSYGYRSQGRYPAAVYPSGGRSHGYYGHSRWR